MSRILSNYGWRPSLPDFRDSLFKAKPKLTAPRPPVFSMRAGMPEVWDQGDEGSCTAHGTLACWYYDRTQQRLPTFMPSRNFAYWNSRDIEGSTGADTGATVRDAVQGLVKYGVCPESEWGYDTVTMLTKPVAKCFPDALPHAVTSYHAVGNDSGATIDEICDQLAGGEPIVFGISVFSSFETDQVAQTGIVPMPQPSESNLGGHCITMVGYDDNRKLIECRNSWGPGWGDHGYFWIPYDYAASAALSDDYWVIRTIAG